MAQTIQARVGDTVRANFNLVFKNAEVQKLKDKENFTHLGFGMESSRPGSAKIAGAANPSVGPIRCNHRPPIGDDQPVEVDFIFEGDSFRENDVWQLFLFYIDIDKPEFPVGGNDPHPRKHLLGMVQLIK